jgi:hypothetical protein
MEMETSSGSPLAGDAESHLPRQGKADNVGGEKGDYVIGSELDAAKKIAALPTSMQARYNDLPGTAQRALLKR